MLEGHRIAVVVPAFNVEARLASVLATMPAFVDHVYVIDDASTDATSDITSSCGDARVRLLRHALNGGVGAAIATGYRVAFDEHCDVIAVMAGDGQMDPDDLHALLDPLVSGRADYAKGNRLRHPSVYRSMPITRLLGNIGLSAMTRAATGLWHIGDSQCGYTAIHRRVLSVLDPSAMWTRYGYPNHLLGALSQAGFRVIDVIVRPVYAGERSGVRVRDAFVTIPRILWRIAMARAKGRDRELEASGGFVSLQ